MERLLFRPLPLLDLEADYAANQQNRDIKFVPCRSEIEGGKGVEKGVFVVLIIDIDATSIPLSSHRGYHIMILFTIPHTTK